MKKSSQVPASLVVALAASLGGSGCMGRDSWQCRDAMGNPMPDSYCRSGGGGYYGGGHWYRVHTGGFGGFSGSGGSFGG